MKKALLLSLMTVLLLVMSQAGTNMAQAADMDHDEGYLIKFDPKMETRFLKYKFRRVNN